MVFPKTFLQELASKNDVGYPGALSTRRDFDSGFKDLDILSNDLILNMGRLNFLYQIVKEN